MWSWIARERRWFDHYDNGQRKRKWDDPLAWRSLTNAISEHSIERFYAVAHPISPAIFISTICICLGARRRNHLHRHHIIIYNIMTIVSVRPRLAGHRTLPSIDFIHLCLPLVIASLPLVVTDTLLVDITQWPYAKLYWRGLKARTLIIIL